MRKKLTMNESTKLNRIDIDKNTFKDFPIKKVAW